MMSIIEVLRNAHTRLINESPVMITIHRVEYVDDGAGGRYKRESDLAAFSGRIAPTRRGRMIITEAGQAREADALLLAPWDADLRAGTGVEDTFFANGRRYRVQQVTVRRWKGEAYAIQADLQEVS